VTAQIAIPMPTPAPAAAAAVLDVRNLVVEFPTRRGVLTAIRGIDLAIRRGEILGVVGESGAGKSLTGAAVIGLLESSGRIASGEIHVSGRRIDRLPLREVQKLRGRTIGAIFQDPLTSLNPLLTVGDQLIETMRVHLPLSRAEASVRAVTLLHEVGIPSPELRLGQYPHQFSGGMRQRVVIALALCAEPELVIADEPTTALDVSIQAQITALLKRVCRDRGTAMMLITHDMGVIAETADRVAVMYAGRIVELGPVASIIRDPRHPYTKGLIGSIPSLKDRSERLAQIDGAMPRLNAMPSGCAFHLRCRLANDECRGEPPPLLAAGSSHAACWRLERG
jgi:peptide/nickel transport system ATP-binding protein